MSEGSITCYEVTATQVRIKVFIINNYWQWDTVITVMIIIAILEQSSQAALLLPPGFMSLSSWNQCNPTQIIFCKQRGFSLRATEKRKRKTKFPFWTISLTIIRISQVIYKLWLVDLTVPYAKVWTAWLHASCAFQLDSISKS